MGVIDAGDELEGAARRRQDAQFLRELVEAFGEAVVNRIVGYRIAAVRDRLVETDDDVGVELAVAGHRGKRIVAERVIAEIGRASGRASGWLEGEISEVGVS